MLLQLIFPLLFSSAIYTETPVTVAPVETQQLHKEVQKDHTVIKSEPDAVHGANCVSLVRQYRPDAPSINASEYPVSTTTHRVGAIGKMHYGDVWHVYYTLEVRDDTLKIVDGNYDNGYVTVRVIPRNDSRIVGYWL